MRRQPALEARRLENDQRVEKNLVRRTAGIDLDDDGEEARHDVRFARRAEKKPALVANAGEPGVPMTVADAVAIDF